jgi:enamine deaminase RidA (YjgF/YER057c/UK114 family)
VEQIRQALTNIVAVLVEGGAEPRHLVRLTWYLLDRDEYNARGREVGAVFREVIGDYDIAMSAVQVAGLVETGAKVEIEATAVVPDLT